MHLKEIIFTNNKLSLFVVWYNFSLMHDYQSLYMLYLKNLCFIRYYYADLLGRKYGKYCVAQYSAHDK